LFTCTEALAIPLGVATVFATTSSILTENQLRKAVIIDVSESENPKQAEFIAIVLTMEEIAPYLENTQRAASSLSANK